VSFFFTPFNNIISPFLYIINQNNPELQFHGRKYNIKVSLRFDSIELKEDIVFCKYIIVAVIFVHEDREVYNAGEEIC
jgi:hypothetical protein